MLTSNKVTADLLAAARQFIQEYERGPEWVSADTADRMVRAITQAEELETQEEYLSAARANMIFRCEYGTAIGNLSKLQNVDFAEAAPTKYGFKLAPGKVVDTRPRNYMPLLCSCGEGDCMPGAVLCPDCISREDD